MIKILFNIRIRARIINKTSKSKETKKFALNIFSTKKILSLLHFGHFINFSPFY